MSRIRSIHPGLWTDDEFVCLSPMARLLFIGLWNECDDGGCFEWKPLRLKMRVLPADNIDIDAVLAELIQGNCIMRYAHDGKEYGAVRNFCRFQKPKKPIYFCPETPEILHWCGKRRVLNTHGSEPVRNRFGTGGEKPIQKGGKEEGKKGGKEEGKEKKKEGNARDEKIAEYAFDGKVIRLNQADYEKWRDAFHAIPDLNGELMALDLYYSARDPKGGKDWFHRTAANLNRKHQERLAEAAKPVESQKKDFTEPSTFLDYMIREREQKKAWEAAQREREDSAKP